MVHSLYPTGLEAGYLESPIERFEILGPALVLYYSVTAGLTIQQAYKLC